MCVQFVCTPMHVCVLRRRVASFPRQSLAPLVRVQRRTNPLRCKWVVQGYPHAQRRIEKIVRQPKEVSR